MIPLGLGELIVLSVLALVLVKPEHLPRLAQKLSGGFAYLRRLRSEITQVLQDLSASQSPQTPQDLADDLSPSHFSAPCSEEERAGISEAAGSSHKKSASEQEKPATSVDDQKAPLS